MQDEVQIITNNKPGMFYVLSVLFGFALFGCLYNNCRGIY